MHIEPSTSWFDRLLWVAIAAGAFGFVWGGCATTRVRPDEASAEEHRRIAAHESALADAERAKYDPAARAIPPFQVQNIPEVGEYNPTERHLKLAATHAAHARQHASAAADLERFEDGACKPLAPAARAACPVLGPIVAVEDIDHGVRLRPADANAIDPLVALMRCHLAYARTRGFANVPDCPLYMRSVEIRLSADGHAIELTSPEAPTVHELRDRVHGLVQSSATLL
jgi:hypothetical protein